MCDRKLIFLHSSLLVIVEYYFPKKCVQKMLECVHKELLLCIKPEKSR